MFSHLHLRGPFSEKVARFYISEITLALEHLHSVSFVCDYKYVQLEDHNTYIHVCTCNTNAQLGELSHTTSQMLENCFPLSFAKVLKQPCACTNATELVIKKNPKKQSNKTTHSCTCIRM